MDDEYDLVPHKEIQELKEELQKLREFPAGPAARLQISLTEVSQKLDKITRIFEEALHDVQSEGGLSVQERLKPISSKIDTLMEQQQEIAKGMIELADIMTSLKQQNAPRQQFPATPPQAPPQMPRPAPIFGEEFQAPSPTPQQSRMPPPLPPRKQ